MTIEIPQIDGTSVTDEVVVEQVNMGTGGLYLNAGDSKAEVTINVADRLCCTNGFQVGFPLSPDGLTLRAR